MGAVREHAERALELWNNGELEQLHSLWAADGVAVFPAGTHSGSLTLPDGSQLPVTGQHLQLRLASVFEVRDGRTVSHRAYFDQLPTVMQLGLVTPTSSPG